MKKNKKIWKLISIVLVLALTVGLLPSGFLGLTIVRAANDSESKWTVNGIQVGGGTSGYDGNGVEWIQGAESEGVNEYKVYCEDGSDTGTEIYQTVSLAEGEYTLSFSYSAGDGMTFYGFIGDASGSSVSPTWVSDDPSEWSVYTQTFTVTEEGTFDVGIVTDVSTAGSWGHFAYISLTDDDGNECLTADLEFADEDYNTYVTNNAYSADSELEDHTPESGAVVAGSTTSTVSVGDEMYAPFVSTSPSVNAWYSYTGSIWGWSKGIGQKYDGYSYGLAFEDWFIVGTNQTHTGYAYYTVPYMPAGTYTLSCEVDNVNEGSLTVGNTSVYPYIDGEQISDYYIQPVSNMVWDDSAQYSVTDGIFSYQFTIDDDETNYDVGFYVAVTVQQKVHLGTWSLVYNGVDEGYYFVSASEISDVTVPYKASNDDILSALASEITVVSTNGTDTATETLPLTWDLSEVDTSSLGSFTATYTYSSDKVVIGGTVSGTITVNVDNYAVIDYDKINGTEVATGMSDDDILGRLASSIDIISYYEGDGDIEYETAALEWDLSAVNTSKAGDYTATYTFTSKYAGEHSGTVTVTVTEVSSDEACIKDVLTKSETTTETKTVERNWSDDYANGTFENVALANSTPPSPTEGFRVNSLSYGSTSEKYAHTGEKSARLQTGNYILTYGGGTVTSYFTNPTNSNAAGTIQLTEETNTDNPTWYYCEATFTTSTVSTSSSPDRIYVGISTYYKASSGIADVYASLHGHEPGILYTYTVSFWYTGYIVGDDGNAYVYIDDVEITGVYDDAVTVETYSDIYYDYTGTYIIDDVTVDEGTVSDISLILPFYATADLVVENGAYYYDESLEEQKHYITADDDTYDYSITQNIPVTWDEASLAAVDTDTAGTYTVTGTAVYGDTSIPVETTVTVNAAKSDDSSGKELIEVLSIEKKEVEWAEGNVDGTFENGTMSNTVPSENGFYSSSSISSGYIRTNNSNYTYSNNGSKALSLTVGTTTTLNYPYLHYGALDTSTCSTYGADSDLANTLTLEAGTEGEFTQYSYKFIATAETMYIFFSVYVNSNNYSAAALYDCVIGNIYTVSFYCTGYWYHGSPIICIDDVVVTYNDDVYYTLYYDYDGFDSETYTVIEGENEDIASLLPEYVSVDLVIEDNDYISDGEDDYAITKDLLVTWDDDSIAAVDTSTAGTYTVLGTVYYDSQAYTVSAEVEVEHTYETVITPATYTNDGSIASVCTVCGDVESSITISKIAGVSLDASSYTYTGSAIEPVITVTDADGNVISSEYYTVTYADNTDIGTATVTLVFTGNYSGTYTTTFTITEADVDNTDDTENTDDNESTVDTDNTDDVDTVDSDTDNDATTVVITTDDSNSDSGSSSGSSSPKTGDVVSVFTLELLLLLALAAMIMSAKRTKKAIKKIL